MWQTWCHQPQKITSTSLKSSNCSKAGTHFKQLKLRHASCEDFSWPSALPGRPPEHHLTRYTHKLFTPQMQLLRHPYRASKKKNKKKPKNLNNHWMWPTQTEAKAQVCVDWAKEKLLQTVLLMTIPLLPQVLKLRCAFPTVLTNLQCSKALQPD